MKRFHFHRPVDLLVKLLLWTCRNYPQSVVADVVKPAKVRTARKTHALSTTGEPLAQFGTVLLRLPDETCRNMKKLDAGCLLPRPLREKGGRPLHESDRDSE